MERANKAMRQKFRRIGHNLANFEKKDELAEVVDVDNRNHKMLSALAGYRKSVCNCIVTGYKEEQPDKRKKKCSEWVLAQELLSDCKELEAVGATCLPRVLRAISHALAAVVEEKVRCEILTERRVVEGLTKFAEADKTLAKSKERLNTAMVDNEIARKALNSKDEHRPDLQEEYDSSTLKLDSLRDATITELFAMAAREPEMAAVCAAYLEEQLELHRFAVRTIENVLPEIKRDIANSRVRPVFGVDLEEHLRHSGRKISLVLNKCCDMIRETGFNEKGLFRVNGNNTKIRRMKAAFDAGEIDNDADAYLMDPHSVCSVLKSYLRELPDPLLTHFLQQHWCSAVRLEGEARVQEMDRLLRELPSAYRDNLAYLVEFLVEMIQYENVTMMSASNLAIVFGPNLLGNSVETDNVTGSKVLETLLQNHQRLFSFNSLHSQPSQALHVDTLSLKGRPDPSPMSSLGYSPSRRPKQPAPAPPVQLAPTQTTPQQAAPPLLPTRQSPPTQTPPTQTPPPRDNHFTPTPPARNYSGGSLRRPRHESYTEAEIAGTLNSHSNSNASNDSLSEYGSESMSRSMMAGLDRPPLRPPPPAADNRASLNSINSLNTVIRTPSVISVSPQNRPVSYNMAVGVGSVVEVEPPVPKPRPTVNVQATVQAMNNQTTTPPAPQVSTPPSVQSDESNRTVVQVVQFDPPERRPKPPLPNKPKADEMTKL